MSRIAIITARGGSKRIPRKNIRLFHGKPVIAYPIKAALESKLFDEVMVSTDDAEIAEVATKYGAKVPFMRSPETSGDMAGTLDVLKEVILKYRSQGINFNQICCIYPVSPLMEPKDLREACKLLDSPNVDFVVPVCRYSTPVQRALRIESGKVTMVNPEMFKVRSQDLEPRFYDVGQYYFLNTDALLNTRSVFTDRTAAYEIDDIRAQDVDNESDWKILEMKHFYLNQK